MTKKVIAALIAVVLVAGCLFVFSGCGETTEPLKIVFLGDSIAEGVLGASPLSEREEYCYYALIGKRNDYIYVNRSVSGHKTAAMLEYISRPDTDAYMQSTHIRTADVIQVSILGNDMLQSDLTGLILEYAQELNGEIDREDTRREEILRESRVNFANIIAKLKELNPTAKIFIQTVYNPMYVGSPIIGDSAKDILKAAPYNYTDETLRDLGSGLLETLNAVVRDYAKNNPGDIYIVDVYQAFDDIYEKDSARGKNLIYPDGIHPSNEGHAVIADTAQALLEELGLADADSALEYNKKQRIKLINKFFAYVEGADEVKENIKNATTNDEVTNLYFRATAGKVPSRT